MSCGLGEEKKRVEHYPSRNRHHPARCQHYKAATLPRGLSHPVDEPGIHQVRFVNPPEARQPLIDQPQRDRQ